MSLNALEKLFLAMKVNREMLSLDFSNWKQQDLHEEAVKIGTLKGVKITSQPYPKYNILLQ